MTNGDKIRAMTNAELANSECFLCMRLHCTDGMHSFDCQKCFCEWLDEDSQTLGMSNADFIRTATNEQLAETINRCGDSYNCPRFVSCEECRLEWLNQDVKVFSNGDKFRQADNKEIVEMIVDMIEEFDCNVAKCARDCWGCVSEWVNQEASPAQD